MFQNKQDFEEPSSLLNSKRATNNYIKPILHEDSIVHTPSMVADSLLKTKTFFKSFFTKQISIVQNEIPIQQLREIEDNYQNNNSIKIVVIILKRMNQTYHAFVSLYSLIVLFTGLINTLYQLRIMGMFLINSFLTFQALFNKQNRSQIISIFRSREFFTLLLYIFSFNRVNLLFCFLLMSLIYVQFIYKFIKIILLIIIPTNYILHFFLPEFFSLIYYVHLSANLKILFTDECQQNQISYFENVNQSFQVFLFDFTFLSDQIEQKVQTFLIVLNLIYTYSIIERYVSYQKCYFYQELFQKFIEDQCVNHNVQLIRIFQFLWELDCEKDQQNFIKQLSKFKDNVYQREIQKCSLFEQLFSSRFKSELSKFGNVILINKHTDLELNGFYLVITGQIKLKLSNQFEFQKTLKVKIYCKQSGDYIGLSRLFIEQQQKIQLKSLTQSSYLFFISHSDFNRAGKLFSNDFEKIRYVSDQLLFSHSTEIIQESCPVCSRYHILQNCQNINYKPVINIEKLKFYSRNERSLFLRSKTKHSKYFGGQVIIDESDSYEETLEKDYNTGDRLGNKNMFSSVSQLIFCNSKVDSDAHVEFQSKSYSNQINQFGEKQVTRTFSNQIGDTIQVLSTSQNQLKSFENDHTNYQIDKMQSYKYYDPNYNIDQILLNFH